MKVFFKESQVWRVLIEIVHGLRVMHSLKIMHRDIKSANIFLFNSSKNQSESPARTINDDNNDLEKGQFLF